MKAIYWFRRDLRIRDNRAVYEALSKADQLAAVFIIDTDFLIDLKMDFKDLRFIFLLDALKELASRIELNIFYGKVREVFEYLLEKYKFEAIFTAYPLSWYEEVKVKEVKELCEKYGVKIFEILDNMLVNPSLIDPSINFTIFYRKWRKLIDNKTTGEIFSKNFISLEEPSIEELFDKHGWNVSENRVWKANWYTQRLKSFDYKMYGRTKDYPYLDGTSKLSPYISLGIVSIREIFNQAVEYSEEFIRQLAWREYYYHIKLKYPFMNKLELKPRMRNISWKEDQYLLNAFKEGKTGYPIIDAGIRQLIKEKWIHNRVRLILANFLVKDLLIDWRIGEKFFKEHLIDYDEVLNIGNWQWSASVGVDPLPLRIFNPIKQSEKFDPSCEYIKKYIPELRDCRCRELHDPINHKIRGYHEPIVNHYEQIKKFRNIMRQVYSKRQY